MGSVAAVVVTYNRRELLTRVLAGVGGQSHPIDEIIVVDNASTDGTGTMIREHFPWVTYLPMPDNLGPGGGRAVGMKAAHERRHDWVWLCDDDILPPVTALECLLDTAQALEKHRVGMISPRCDYTGYARSGIGYWRGRFVAVEQWHDSRLLQVDLATFSGAIVSEEAIAAVGYPQAGYFIGWEDFEYCLRLRKAGFRIFVSPTVVVHHLADYGGGSLLPWRGYYQTRNHLAMALEHRSPREVFWWAVRQAKFLVATILYLDHKRERIRLRVLGAWHGLWGKTGRTIDPAQYALKKVEPK